MDSPIQDWMKNDEKLPFQEKSDICIWSGTFDIEKSLLSAFLLSDLWEDCDNLDVLYSKMYNILREIDGSNLKVEYSKEKLNDVVEKFKIYNTQYMNVCKWLSVEEFEKRSDNLDILRRLHDWIKNDYVKELIHRKLIKNENELM